MKVCTDACILGAWFARQIPGDNHVLDIGTGSGLLTLMLAQKSKGKIHSIEIDTPSFEQARENIEQSKWKGKISIFNDDALIYTFPHLYDFIISNPPFYEDDLKSPDTQKNLAMHSTALTLEALTGIIETNLAPDGSFGILIPYRRTDAYITLAQSKGFFLAAQLSVKQTPGHHYFRSILHFTRNRHDVKQYELIIKDEKGVYTQTFITLLKDYYLHL